MSVYSVEPLTFPWQTLDPFLFCVHHDDAYPAGTEDLGVPPDTLRGRNLGMDFEGRDGWRMYHGHRVPGFPQHPHRGFETVTIVRNGLIDHSDSLGAVARFGEGDVQWMTAGKGIVHSEMFPLLRRDADNPLELFQIWINLPAANKFAEPYFSMYWGEDREQLDETDATGKATTLRVLAGAIKTARGVAPPPDSWAARPEAGVAIFTIKMEAGAEWTLPAAEAGLHRALYFFRGRELTVADRSVPAYSRVLVDPARDVALRAGAEDCELLVLQGRPIGEPVAQYGPFVMNYSHEIQQAMVDYQTTGFGGWPWPADDPVHPRDMGRFARHADGREERPPGREDNGSTAEPERTQAAGRTD